MTGDTNRIVQYILVNKSLKWPVGAIAANACHASTAAIWISRESLQTKQYMEDLDNMHKIVLGADNAEALVQTASALQSAGIAHKLWIEQPEGVVAMLASAPQTRDVLAPYFSPFKLLR
jgi:peptidyl-tRNA hydrolase